MKQIIQSAKTGQLGTKDVPAPDVRPGTVLVRTLTSLISPGTERMIVDFAKKSLAGKAKERPDLVRKVLDKAKRDGLIATFKAVMARLDEPLPLGYSAVGEVLKVGPGLEGAFSVGQRVAIAGAGIANHAELNVVPRNLVVPIPDDVDDQEACFATMGSIALHSVRNLDVGLGDVVAVMGVGMVGQLAARFLTLQGARVIALDYDDARLTLAKTGGAEQALNLGAGNVAETVAAFTAGRGCDAILIAAATDSSEPLRTAAEIARDRAPVVMVGKTGTEFPYGDFMKKELSVMVSRSYGPGRYDDDFEGRGVKYPVGFVRWTETDNLAETVRLMSQSLPNRLDVSGLITHTFPFDRADDAYQLVTKGTEPHMGVVLTYGGDVDVAATSITASKFPSVASAGGDCVLGVLGAGNFARTILLPELKGMSGVNFHTVVTQRGASGEHTQKAFGFGRASTDVDAVLADPDINATLILTRHGTHADLTARALGAGKSVLVEKPLALDRDELDRVVQARANSSAFFCVGFNRRFAPMSVKARDLLAGQAGPKVAVLRVNAGALPADSWVNAAEEGGGRILGEVCHFIDLARFLIGADIVSVGAESAGATGGVCDDLAVTLHFADGSLATIVYTAQGDTAYSKERFEVFAGGTVVTIDNFQSMTVTAGGRTKTEKALGGQDKGHKAELKAFVEGVKTGTPPADEAELVQATLATIAVLESLREGQAVSL